MPNFCPDCGKECFETRERARKALENVNRRNRANGSVYFCPGCNSWHISHVRYKTGKAIRDSIKKRGYGNY